MTAVNILHSSLSQHGCGSSVLFLANITHYYYACNLRVESYSSDNRMSARNLAVVFAPTLMRAPSHEKILVHDLPMQKYFVECIILKHDVLFR